VACRLEWNEAGQAAVEEFGAKNVTAKNNRRLWVGNAAKRPREPRNDYM